MPMAFLFLFIWQVTGDARYQGPLQKCVEATYAGSDLKGNVEKVNDRMREKYPTLTALAPIGYAIGIKKQVSVTTSKVSPVPNTVTSYNFDERAKSGSIGITWRF